LKKVSNPQIEELMGNIKCPKDYECYKSQLKNLCKAQDIGMESFLLCLDKKSNECIFSMPVTDLKKFCRCPLRVYIAKVLKK
jgi:hypothetical protein